MAVQLLIKSPNQHVDVKVDCDLTWSVERLKEHLSSVYPTKPAKSQQRIIYSGRLLPDHLLLKDVLTQGRSVHTMHLVCPSSTSSNRSNVPEVPSQEPAKEAAAEQSAPYSTVMPAAAPAEGLRQRLVDSQQHIPSTYGGYPQYQVPFNTDPVASTYMAYQLAMQQTYAQIMAQYLAQGHPGYLNGASSFLPPQPLGSAAAPTSDAGSNVTQAANPAAPRRPQNANEEEGLEHDLLDSLYILTRVLMLCAVLYFYSTPGRILLVLSLTVVFCLYRISSRRQAQQASEQIRPVERRNEQSRTGADIGPEAGTEDAQEAVPNGDAQRSGAENAVRETAPEPSSPSIFSIAFTFVKTFFTSLIPEQPLPLEIN